jgi:DNA helicase-2/ATP-dependent DNA helicase PcrA
MVGVEEGLLPYWRAVSEAEQGEELRLMFVACSRAKRWLTLSYAHFRFSMGHWAESKPSPFLSLLPEEHRSWPDRDRRPASRSSPTPAR